MDSSKKKTRQEKLYTPYHCTNATAHVNDEGQDDSMKGKTNKKKKNDDI